MEVMDRSKGRDRRSYTPEFKSEIVDRCRAVAGPDVPGQPVQARFILAMVTVDSFCSWP